MNSTSRGGTFQDWLLARWYGSGSGTWGGTFWLAPLALIYRLLLHLRAWAYAIGVLRVTRLPVPVIVVGNITAGGTGKTPLVITLARWLAAEGWRPGIISRGYAGRVVEPIAVTADSDPGLTGDEPVLMARRAEVPVWAGPRRAEVGRALLAAHPEVDVLIGDDGLQHHALARDIEIAVVDGRRGLGNGHLLPWGPLREPAGRLARVDAVVSTGVWAARSARLRVFESRLRGDRFQRLDDPAVTHGAADFAELNAGRTVTAVAGIGHPERFFADLEGMGLILARRPFPDHHHYTVADLPPGPLVMTGKDAVKCQSFATPEMWVREVDAEVDPALKALILNLLETHRHGQQAA